jgi:hypothetical protein
MLRLWPTYYFRRMYRHGVALNENFLHRRIVCILCIVHWVRITQFMHCNYVGIKTA